MEHGSVDLAGALRIVHSVYASEARPSESAEEAVARCMFGFSRAENDFIELSIGGPKQLTVELKLPLKTGWWIFKSRFRQLREVQSLTDVEDWVRRYFELSQKDLYHAWVQRGAV